MAKYQRVKQQRYCPLFSGPFEECDMCGNPKTVDNLCYCNYVNPPESEVSPYFQEPDESIRRRGTSGRQVKQQATVSISTHLWTCGRSSRMRALDRGAGPGTGYTPSTLEAMVQDYERLVCIDTTCSSDVCQIECHLLRLPQEIRDMVYTYVLVADAPIELSPNGQCQCDLPRHWTPSYDINSRYWHIHQWKNVYRPALRLLRVCRQIHKEAAQIYYSQPFRFSSEWGWMTLYHWLKQIGPRNRPLVKDITVCHPGSSAEVEADGHVSILRCKQHAFELEVPLLDPFSFRLSRHKMLDFHERWPGWRTLPHPAYMLAGIRGLCSLRLIVKRSHMHFTHPTYGFLSLLEHPIHGFFNDHRPGLETTVVNFISSVDQGSSLSAAPIAMDFSELAFMEQAQEYFDLVKAKGWKVVEEMHDADGTCPAQPVNAMQAKRFASG